MKKLQRRYQLKVLLSDAERKCIERLAFKAGMSVSGWIRWIIRFEGDMK